MLFNLKFATFICVLFFLEIRFYNAEEDLYSVLGVEPSASARTIKQAYKSLAKVWHPDKNNEPDANDKFMKINQAYEVVFHFSIVFNVFYFSYRNNILHIIFFYRL